MKKMRTLFSIAVLLLVAGEVVAQVTQKHHSSIRDFAMSIPLDGGLFLAMAIGLVYGATVLSNKS